MQTIDKMIMIATKGNVPVMVSHYLIGGSRPTIQGMDELVLFTQDLITPGIPIEAIVVISEHHFHGLKELFANMSFLKEGDCTFENVERGNPDYISAYLGGITFHFTRYAKVISFLKRVVNRG